MKIKEVIDKLNDKNTPKDTKYSSKIFIKYEEGKEDVEIKEKVEEGGKRKARRDWIVLAEIYNNGECTQKFHLLNYLNFKLANGLTENDDFSYSYIANSALRLYIREVIEGEEVDDYYNTVKTYYERGGAVNKAPRWEEKSSSKI